MNVNGNLTPAVAGTILRDEYQKNLLENGKYVIGNPCLTYDSDTATMMGATLSQDIEDAQVKYISNIIDLDELKAAYETWHAMGGDMILADYQAQYEAENK